MIFKVEYFCIVNKIKRDGFIFEWYEALSFLLIIFLLTDYRKGSIIEVFIKAV